MLKRVNNFLSQKFWRLKIWALVVLVIALTVTVCVALRFQAQVVRYGWASFCIEQVEKEVAQGTWTAGGIIHWTEDLIQRGKEAKAYKESLIYTYDVCRWLATSAETVTGQIVRVVTVGIVIMLAIICLYMIVIIGQVLGGKVLKKRAKAERLQNDYKESSMQG